MPDGHPYCMAAPKAIAPDEADASREGCLACHRGRCLRLGSGAIVIDARGQVDWGHNSHHFAVAMMHDGMNAPAVWLTKA